MAELKNRAVRIKVSDWTIGVIDKLFDALIEGVNAGMPVDVAEEIAKEVTTLIYRKAITVEDMRPKPVMLDDCGFPVSV